MHGHNDLKIENDLNHGHVRHRNHRFCRCQEKFEILFDKMLVNWHKRQQKLGVGMKSV